MLHLINRSHLPDLDLAEKQKQGWLQWKWVGSEMAKCPQTCQGSLTHHDWKQREKRVCTQLFSPSSIWTPPSSLNEWSLYPQTPQKSGNKLTQKKTPTSRKYTNWVKLLSEERKWRFEFILKKTKHNSLSQHSNQKKKWLEGAGELPAAEEAGKNYQGVHEAEHCVLPVTHLAQHPSCRQADIPIVRVITSYNASSCCAQ